MPLTMRATGLASPVDEERQDFTIYSGDWATGRIYAQRGGPDHMRWFWSFYGVFGKPADMRTDGYAPTLDEANGAVRGGVAAVAGMGQAVREAPGYLKRLRKTTDALSMSTN
jgi:hypothetical protein